MTSTDGGAERYRRSEARVPVLLNGELCHRVQAIACRIRDMSRGGACIEMAKHLSAGVEVTLIRGTLNVRGRITWSSGRRHGIRFDMPIRATELLVQMSQARQRAEPN